MGDSPRAPPNWWYTLIGNIHYLHFGVILFFISGLVAMSVSLLTAPIDRKHLHRLTFWTRHSREVRIDMDEDTQYNTSENTGGCRILSRTNQTQVLCQCECCHHHDYHCFPLGILCLMQSNEIRILMDLLNKVLRHLYPICLKI